MNFLAHSLLGFDDEALLVGQLAGDFVRGRDLGALPARVALGVRLHRSIDAFTDAHPATAGVRARFAPGLRRYAGIALDIGCDHVLAREWPAGAALTSSAPAPDLGAHAARIDAALRRHAAVLPAGLARFAPHLVRVLPTWADREGVAATLDRLSRRSPRFAPLAVTAAELERLDAELRAMVHVLWPAAALHARDMLSAHAPTDTRR